MLIKFLILSSIVLFPNFFFGNPEASMAGTVIFLYKHIMTFFFWKSPNSVNRFYVFYTGVAFSYTRILNVI